MATENIKVVKIDTQPAQISVKDLRQELKALKDTLLSTEQGTEEYNKALQQAADIQHTLKEQTEELNASAMDFGQITGNIIKATGGLVAGLQAAKATMNLFGIENEEVLKSLEKMQNLMSLTQALPALDEGRKAFGRLKNSIAAATGATSKFGKALISTGLGAIVAALGYVVTHFEEISKWLDEVTGQTDFLGNLSDKVMGGLNAGWAAIVQSLKAVGNAIVTYVTAPFKSVMDAINAYTSTNGSFADKLKAAGKAMKDGFVSEWKDVGNDFKKVGEVAANAYQEGYEKNKAKRLEKQRKEAEKEWKEYVTKREQQLNDELKLEEAKNKTGWKYTEEGKKHYDDYFNDLLKLYKKDSHEYNKVLIEKLNYEKDYENQLQQQAQRQQEIQEKRDEYLREWASKEIYNYSDKLTQIQSEQDAELVILKEAWDRQIIDEETYQQLKTDIEQKYANQRTAIAQKELDDEVKIQEQKLNAYLDIANGFSNILGSLADSMDESNKEQFEAAKAFNISAAIISTIAGAIGAYTGAASNAGINAIPIAGPAIAQALGIANAAAVAAGGAAQIAQLSKKQFGDKSVNKTSIAKPNTSAVSSVIAPVQYTQDVQGASIEGAIKDTKVYVTETDITNTQNKVSVTENEARF